jgi:hypothetical protein
MKNQSNEHLTEAIITLQEQVKNLFIETEELRFRLNHNSRFKEGDTVMFRGWDKKIHEGTVRDVELKMRSRSWEYRVKENAAGGRMHEGLTEAVLFDYDELNPGKRP